MSAPAFKPCERCGHVPKMVRRGEKDDWIWVLDLNPSCELCMGFEVYGAGPDDERRLPNLWNGLMPASARILKLRDDGKLAARPVKSGCGAMVRELKFDGIDVPRALESACADLMVDGKSVRRWLTGLSKAQVPKLKAEVAKLFDEGSCRCGILGRPCPRGTGSRGEGCCLPAYAASKPADKLDDETLAAIAGMVGCLDCDCLGKHWYLSECGNCDRVDAHLKCYYLAAEYRKRLESRKGSAK